MSMAHNGLAKLAEELGELSTVVGKMLAFGTGDHPDGAGNLLIRFEDEAADVKAAISFVSSQLKANTPRMRVREQVKLQQFYNWERIE